MAPAPFVARSLLFAPGDNERKLTRAIESPADVILCDLEDSVAADRKLDARARVTALLEQAISLRDERVWVRINPLDQSFGLDDLVSIVPKRPGGIMLPKATPTLCRRLDHYLTALEAAANLPIGRIAVLPIATETPEAVFRIGDYVGIPRLVGLTWGAEDIATALGASTNRQPDGQYAFPFQFYRALCLTGAAAAGVAPIETIHGEYRDLDGLEAVASQARQSGFRGMMAIHPDQVPIINRCFAPSPDEIGQAERIIAAFAADPAAGTIGLDGQMFDRPHLRRAELLLTLDRQRSGVAAQ